MCYFLLFCGSLLLSLVVAYLFWVQIRVVRLQSDICYARKSLAKDASRLNAISDREYRATDRVLEWFLEAAPKLSPLTLTYAVGEIRAVAENLPKSESTPASPELMAVLDAVERWLADRIVSYFVDETVSGFVVWAISRMLPSSFHAKKKATDVVLDSFEPFSNSGMPLSGAGMCNA